MKTLACLVSIFVLRISAQAQIPIELSYDEKSIPATAAASVMRSHILRNEKFQLTTNRGIPRVRVRISAEAALRLTGIVGILTLVSSDPDAGEIYIKTNYIAVSGPNVSERLLRKGGSIEYIYQRLLTANRMVEKLEFISQNSGDGSLGAIDSARSTAKQRFGSPVLPVETHLAPTGL